MSSMSNRYLLEQTHSQVSLAVRLTDDYAAGGQPVGKESVLIRGHNFKSIKTPGGYYVFSDLPVGSYTVVVQSEYYFDEEIEIDTCMLELLNPVVNISLRPNAGYPFPDGATLIRGMICNQMGQGIHYAVVSADIMVPETAVKARLGTPASNAEDTIMLININGSLNIGDYLMIKDSNRSNIEFCQIAAPLPDNSAAPFKLTKPLQFKHSANTPLYLLAAGGRVNTKTSGKGEFVIYFNQLKNDRLLTVLNISCPDYQTEQQIVEVCEGGLTSLGIIVLSPY